MVRRKWARPSLALERLSGDVRDVAVEVDAAAGELAAILLDQTTAAGSIW